MPLTAVVAIVGVVVVVVSPNTFGLNQGLNGASSGRAGLVGGGAQLFGDRPVWGYGSGSFETEYHRIRPGSAASLSASHTIPITIAAEQGLIGELAYLALVVVAGVVLVRGARSDGARAAIAATFLALVFHTLLYADFLEDPITWTLLGIGTALAFAAARAGRAPDTVSSSEREAVGGGHGARNCGLSLGQQRLQRSLERRHMDQREPVDPSPFGHPRGLRRGRMDVRVARRVSWCTRPRARAASEPSANGPESGS